MDNENLEQAKIAGQIHKQIRNEIHEWIKPGLYFTDICNTIENRIKELTNFDQNTPLKGGIAFPTGVSVNNCAAHWTPNPRDNNILKENDVCKIDYGVHINGMIVDSAFTISFNPVYDKLLESSKTSTDIGIKYSGVDSILGEIGAEIQENMESYEIELNGKVYPINSVKQLTGHQIEQYRIHAPKRVPNFNLKTYTERMKENEYYAIETFATTGKSGDGSIINGNECSHYMMYFDVNKDNLKGLSIKDKKFLSQIQTNFGTLAFCNRWLNNLKINRYDHFLKSLIKNNIVEKYPPLYDIKGSYVAQFEHTIYIGENNKIILSDQK